MDIKAFLYGELKKIFKYMRILDGIKFIQRNPFAHYMKQFIVTLICQ